MAKKGRSPFTRSPEDRLEKIKRLAVVAMFSDDDLLERLVLKGGNALNLVHHVTTRASVDLDFSMEKAFAPGELDSIRERVEHRLNQTFAPVGYTVFDVKLDEKPEGVTPDLADFWGGYRLEFKLIDTTKAAEFGAEINAIRRNAVPVGLRNRTRFEIDISKFEYCTGKQAIEFDGFTIYVYTPQMVVCEKLRSQFGPFTRSPPTLRHLVKIEVEHEPAALSFHDAAHFDQLGAHSAQTALLLLL